MDKKQKQKLRKFLRELELIKGRHTELVSVYVPQGYELIKIIQHLQQEQGTASNIKDAKTRKHVIDSLERAIVHLRLYKKTPENGLAVFAGNASDKDNKVDIKVWSIEPPEPIKVRLYRCDQNFMTDILKDMFEDKEVHGLIVIDNREANVGLLKGSSITEIYKSTSDVPGKTTKGGQSQQRYARIRELAAHDFYKRVADVVNKQFLSMEELKGILIGGPGHTKETFFNGNYLNNELKKKVLGLRDLSYTGEFGLNELVDKSKDLLAEEVITKEKEILNRFFELLAKEPEKTAYGKKEVEKALENGAVDTLLISEELDDKYIEKLEEKADSFGTKVEIVSVETKEGVQLKELGGVVAMLRFAVY
ncbi:MAG: peptide chain release factor aRF-1 [Nanoarchaeota archaeon]|nr:peptide chain release factor aRF-1 [Nanoarchaeota archaeon]